MKLFKSVLNAVLLALLLTPAVLFAQNKPTPEKCPCWYENADNGIWAAVDEVGDDVVILRYREHDLKPDDYFVQLEVVECVHDNYDPPDPSICQEMWVTTKWQPTYSTYMCEVRIYDYQHFARTPVYEQLITELEFKSCVSATNLVRQTAKE